MRKWLQASWYNVHHPIKALLGDHEERTLVVAEWYWSHLDDVNHSAKDRNNWSTQLRSMKGRLRSIEFNTTDVGHRDRARALLFNMQRANSG